MNEVRRELERAHAQHDAEQAATQASKPQKKKRIRNWLRGEVLRQTSTKR